MSILILTVCYMIHLALLLSIFVQTIILKWQLFQTLFPTALFDFANSQSSWLHYKFLSLNTIEVEKKISSPKLRGKIIILAIRQRQWDQRRLLCYTERYKWRECENRGEMGTLFHFFVQLNIILVLQTTTPQSWQKKEMFFSNLIFLSWKLLLQFLQTSYLLQINLF